MAGALPPAAIRSIESGDGGAIRDAILQVLGDYGYAGASADIRSAFRALPVLHDACRELLTGAVTAAAAIFEPGRRLMHPHRTSGPKPAERNLGDL